MSEPVTYARAGGPPDDWQGLRVFKVKTGEEVLEVVEVSTKDNWLKRLVTDREGKPIVKNGELVVERIRGLFEIRRADGKTKATQMIDRPGVRRLVEGRK